MCQVSRLGQNCLRKSLRGYGRSARRSGVELFGVMDEGRQQQGWARCSDDVLCKVTVCSDKELKFSPGKMSFANLVVGKVLTAL